MYVPYRCCQKSFEDYYVSQTGSGGLGYYSGAEYQKGYGLGGLFRSFFRMAVPLLKSGAKALGRQVMHSGINVLGDISRGEDAKMAAKRRFKEAGQQLTDKAATRMKAMIGSGKFKKRKRVRKRASTKRRGAVVRRKVKKRKISDIFG